MFGVLFGGIKRGAKGCQFRAALAEIVAFVKK